MTHSKMLTGMVSWASVIEKMFENIVLRCVFDICDPFEVLLFLMRRSLTSLSSLLTPSICLSPSSPCFSETQ